MKSQVVLFTDVPGARIGDLTRLCPSGVILPKGFSLIGGARKFIVLIGEDEVVIAIGPPMMDEYYYHKDILAASKEKFGHLKISGGGQVSFTAQNDKGEVKWFAKLDGSSGDFGVFDPLALAEDVRKSVSKALGMGVAFAWRNL